MQSTPLGEYAARLGLLRAFAAQAAASGGPRARPTAAVLTNVARLFDLHTPSVSAAAAAAVAPLAKQLADFVALARWEDRGYYANRAAAEKAARHLHRLGRRARAALGAPAAPVLSGAGTAMGLADLEPGAVLAAAGGGVVKAEKGGGVSPLLAVQAVDPAAAGAAWRTACAAAAASASAAPPPPPAATRVAAVPRLTARLATLAAPLIEAVASESATHAGSPAAADLDMLAGDAAARALALRGETAPAARPRKKKALSDLLAALVAVGASRSVSGVPRADRAPAAWMAAPGLEGALLAKGGGDARLAAAAASKLLAEADGYYFRAIARVQRLRAASTAPHEDVTASEAAAAVRLCESVLYAGRRGRAALVAAAAQADRLESLAAACAGGVGGVASQAGARTALASATGVLPRAAARLADGAALLEAAAGAERAAERRARLGAGAGELAGAASAVGAAATTLAACPAVSAASDPAMGGTVTPAALASVRAALATAAGVATRLAVASAAGAPDLPGWGRATRALRSAAAASVALEAATPSITESATVHDAFARLPATADAAVDALLAWTQALAGHGSGGGADPTTPLPPLAAAVADAEERLRPRALRAACDALGALLADAATVADGGNAEQGKKNDREHRARGWLLRVK